MIIDGAISYNFSLGHRVQKLECPQRSATGYRICMDNILSVGGQRQNFLTALGLKYHISAFALVGILTEEMIQLYEISNFKFGPHLHLEDKVDFEAAVMIDIQSNVSQVIHYSRVFHSIVI